MNYRLFCKLCGIELVVSFFGPVAAEWCSGWPCRDGYPLYGDNGQHVAVLVWAPTEGSSTPVESPSAGV